MGKERSTGLSPAERPLTGFDPFAFERQFEPLQDLSRRVWLPALINTEGDMLARIAVLQRWQERLFLGRPLNAAHGGHQGESNQQQQAHHQTSQDPRVEQTRSAPQREPVSAGSLDLPDCWPGTDVAQVFGAVARRLELHKLTYRHDEITNQVLRNLLWHIDRISIAQGHVGRQQAVALAGHAFESDWDHQSFELKEVLRVFQSLDGIQNFAKFSKLSGLLRDEAWQSVLAAHEAIALMPELARLIRRLGRARSTDSTVEQASETQDQQITEKQWLRRWLEMDLPGAGYETEGVYRSGDLSRILASEAMQLRRPAHAVGLRRARRLRRLFAARLAEHALLTYQQRERYSELGWVLADEHAMAQVPRPRPELMRGPLIICIDTSSSMAGGPEAVGKAVVLEAMKTAHRESRACRVYSFSGPGDLRSFELPLDVDGILNVAGFLSSSFHGGTDIVDPLESALDDIEGAKWQGADIIIASDGEFGATRATRDRIARVKMGRALRVQGILIGDRETMGLREVCDDIFWVSDWRRFGKRHGQTETVVHDRNLTSIYFPDARL